MYLNFLSNKETNVAKAISTQIVLHWLKPTAIKSWLNVNWLRVYLIAVAFKQRVTILVYIGFSHILLEKDSMALAIPPGES